MTARKDPGYTSHMIAGNPQRRIDAARADSLRNSRGSVGKANAFPMEWGDRAKGNPDSKTCDTCRRNAQWMRLIGDGIVECSHLECPHRKAVTARGGDYFDGRG